MKYCSKCGAQFPDENAFCPNCGTPSEAVNFSPEGETTVLNEAAYNEAPANPYAAPQQPYQAPQQPPYQQAPQANPYAAPQPPQANPYGAPQPPQGNPYGAPQPPQGNPYGAPAPAPQEEKASIGLAILSFFIPLVGLILFLTKRKDRPKTAKACIIAAAISMALGIIFSIIATVVGNKAAKTIVDDPDITSSFVDDGDKKDDKKDDKKSGSECEIGEGLVRVWEDEYGSKCIMVAVPVTNNTKEDWYLPSSDMDIEDKDGNLVQTLSFVSAAPAVVKPGETAYYYQNTTFEGSDVNAEYKLIDHIKPEEPGTFWTYVRLETSEVNSKLDTWDDVSFTGRVENTTDEAITSAYVYVNVFDKDGNFLGQSWDYVDALDPGEKIGFETSSYGWEYGLDDIGSYDIFAYALV